MLPAIAAGLGGLVVLLVALVAYTGWTRTPLPSAAQWAAAPWWSWTGGILGCAYVLAMVNAPEKVGAGMFVGITVTAAIVTSLALDHFGVLGLEPHTASVPRLLGGALMIGGVGLLAKF